MKKQDWIWMILSGTVVFIFFIMSILLCRGLLTLIAYGRKKTIRRSAKRI